MEVSVVVEYQKKLRAEINLKIKSRLITKTEIAHAIGFKSVVDLGRYLTIKEEETDRKFSVDMIDALTEKLGLCRGFFYPLFLGELKRKPMKGAEKGTYFEDKTKRFIRSCLEVGMLDLASDVINQVISEKDTGFIFELAEEIFHFAESKYPYSANTVNYEHPEYQHALFLYEIIISKEKRLSEVLAISHFRKFFIQRLDKNKVHDLFNSMKLFIPYLPTHVRIAALERVCAYYSTHFKWDELIEASFQLEALAIEMNDEDKRGYALLVRGIAYVEKGIYPETFEVIGQYKNIEGFERCAEENYLFALVKSGDLTRVNELIQNAYAKSGTDQRSTMAVILEKLYEADMYELAIEVINFCTEQQVYKDNANNYNQLRKLKYMKYKSLILIKMGRSSGIDTLLEAMHLALELEQTLLFGQLVNVFRTHTNLTSKEHMLQFFDVLERR